MPNTFEPIKCESLCIELTTQCNSNCIQCFVQNGLSEHATLSLDAVKTIIASGYASGFRQLHFTGGEPLLWDGLFGALDYAIGKRYRAITMNTNGSLLTTEIAHKLATYKALSVSVSLDGPEIIHDRFRGKNSYRQTIAGIQNALDAGINLRIFTVARKSLLPFLPHFANDLFKTFCDIKYLTLIQLICVTDMAIPFPEELLEVDDFIKMVQTVSLLNLKGLKTKIKNSPLAMVAADMMGMSWMPPSPPIYREDSLMVRANGNISLSHSTRSSFGKYEPGMIQKVMDSREYKTAVAPNQSICPACNFTGLCRESGLIRPSDLYMHAPADEPYCKKVLKQIAK